MALCDVLIVGKVTRLQHDLRAVVIPCNSFKAREHLFDQLVWLAIRLGHHQLADVGHHLVRVLLDKHRAGRHHCLTKAVLDHYRLLLLWFHGLTRENTRMRLGFEVNANKIVGLIIIK